MGPRKVVILIQNIISKFSQTKNQTQKISPKVPKKLKTYIRRPQIKKFYKTDPPKVVILIQNTILKFSKTKNQTQKIPLKFKKIKNIYKEASNQKVSLRLGAEGPQQGPKGPQQGPKGPSPLQELEGGAR